MIIRPTLPETPNYTTPRGTIDQSGLLSCLAPPRRSISVCWVSNKALLRRAKRETCVCLIFSHFVVGTSAPTKPSKFCPRPLGEPDKTAIDRSKQTSLAEQTNIVRIVDD